MAAPHHFLDYRGLIQLRLDTVEDLERMHELDPARWSATSVPITQLLCDPAFLGFVDVDGDGRIRVQDLLAAHRWATSLLKNEHRLVEVTETIRVEDLKDGGEAERLKLLISQRLSSSATDAVSLTQIRAFAESYKKKLPNGDGVVTPAQVTDAPAQALAQAVVAFNDGAPDLSGDRGVDMASLDAYLAHGKLIEAWRAERTYDDALAGAIGAITALAREIDRFFLLCDLVALDEHAAERMTATVEALKALDVGDAAVVRAYLEKQPLQRPTPDAVLDLEKPLNALYADDVKKLAATELARVLQGPVTRLTKEQWQKFKDALAFVIEHEAKKPKDIDLAAMAATDPLRALIVEDERASLELAGLKDLERLALYQRWLLPLANNMVSFPGLFVTGERCLFEAGTLVLDGRDLSFCVGVIERSSHKAVAEHSNCFVVYCELARTEAGVVSKREVACAVTSGTRRGIAVGKRGVFYDREGKEHDAVVVDIIERPISLYEAAISPFVRLREFIADRVVKLTQSSLTTLEKRAATMAATTPTPPTPLAPGALPSVAAPAPAPTLAPAAPVAPAASGLQGLLVGGGIAIAALGSAAAFAIQTLASIAPLHFFAGALALVVAVMALAGFLGWLKLRKRDLSTLLEACGWAFNVRIYLTRRHSLRFTRVPPLPKGSLRERIILPAIAAEQESTGTTALLLFLLVCALVVAAIALREPLMQLLWPLTPG